MGVVPMEIENGYRVHGSYLAYQAVYVYCDRCGTFNVKAVVHPREWFKIGCGLTIFVILLKLSAAGRLNPLFAYFSLIFAAIWIAGTWGIPAYRCQKCHCSTSTRYNTRNLPSDPGLVDVPEAKIQKFCLNTWTDLCELDEYLKPPDTPRS
jgi:hypothetical protein